MLPLPPLLCTSYHRPRHPEVTDIGPQSPRLPRAAPQDQSGSISRTRTKPRPAEKTKDHRGANAKLKHIQQKSTFRLSVCTPCGCRYAQLSELCCCIKRLPATAKDICTLQLIKHQLCRTLIVKSAVAHKHENKFPSLPSLHLP